MHSGPKGGNSQKFKLISWGKIVLENQSTDHSTHNSEKIMSLDDPKLTLLVFKLAETRKNAD